MKIVVRLAICVGISLSWTSSMSWAAHGSGADWGARDPTPCVPLTQTEPPTAEQAATLVRCLGEVAVPGRGLSLMENVRIEVGAAVPFIAMYNQYDMPDADTNADTYPIRGSFTWSTCMTRHDAASYGNPDLNCEEGDVNEAAGLCWRTSFGDWRCRINGAIVETRKETAPPQ